MPSVKVALLDDNKEQLAKNSQLLEELNGITIVSQATAAAPFLKEVAITEPDVLLLDLNLGDSYMTGMEVAFDLRLPVLFVSSNTANHIKEMEHLKREHNLCVDHLTKPFSDNDFKKTVTRFLKEVAFFAKETHVHLDFGSAKRNKISLNSIVYLEANKANGSQSNNKTIHFTNKKSEHLIDFSFTKMEEKGLLKSQFLTIHKSFRVNKDHIKSYNRKTESVEVEIFHPTEKSITMHLPVSENYIVEVKHFKK